MSTFYDKEVEYLREQILGRIATVNPDGQPHVVPVGFRYNAETGTIDIGGHNLERTRKFRDASAHPQVAFVVDDLLTTNPWRPRGLEIRGTARVFTEGGERIGPGFGGPWIRITPQRVISWGLDADSQPNPSPRPRQGGRGRG